MAPLWFSALTATAPALPPTWCAVIETPDGFLNLRAGPSTEYPVIRQLYEDDFLDIDTGFCRETLGQLLCDENELNRKWVFVEAVSGSVDTQGWVNSGYLRQVRCPGAEP